MNWVECSFSYYFVLLITKNNPFSRYALVFAGMFYKLLTCLKEKTSHTGRFELYLMLPTEERLTRIGMNNLCSVRSVSSLLTN